MEGRSDIEKIINKMEMSYQSVAKTVSDFGSSIKRNNDEIIEIKTLLKDFVHSTTKLLDKHEKSIDSLEASDVEIRSVFKGSKWTAGLAVVVIISLISTITAFGIRTYTGDLNQIHTRIDKHEVANNDTIGQILTLLKNDEKLRAQIR